MNYLNTEENRKSVIELFPGLEGDERFEVNSPNDNKYNCLAFAASRTDRFWWPAIADGCFWPLDDLSTEFNNLILAYETVGYQLCDSWEFDPKLKKIALYVDDNNQFTHASRQLRIGLWTSKLGQAFDIIHGTPYTIEGDVYGKVGAFMSAIY